MADDLEEVTADRLAITARLTESIQAKGPEFLLGMDIQRAFATGVQAFVNSDFGLVVFREQSSVNDANGQPKIALKNVASVALPTEVIREFHKLLGEQLSALDADQA